MSTENLTAFPSKASYSEADVAYETAEPKWLHGAVVAVFIRNVTATKLPLTKGRNGPGEDLALKIQLGVLDPEDQSTPLSVNGLFANAIIRLPLRDPDHADTHTIPQWIRNFWENFCTGFLPEDHKAVFRRDFASNQEYVNAKNEAGRKRLEEAVAAVEHQGAAYVGNIAYATISITESEDGRVFTNFQRFRPELRADEELSPLEEIYDDGLPKEEVPFKKKGKKKTGAVG